jgi:hypothetical protein
MSNPKPISLREYARHRAELGLVGATPTAVWKAVKSGRLRASVARDERGQPKIADPALADREWTAGPLISQLVALAEALREQLLGTKGAADGDA